MYIGKNQTYGSDKNGFSFTISNKFDTMSPDGESTVNLAVLAAFDGIKQKLLYQKPDCEVQGQPHVHCILLLKRS
jgi:hypothetical protein